MVPMPIFFTDHHGQIWHARMRPQYTPFMPNLTMIDI